jgi:hypothetical protein
MGGVVEAVGRASQNRRFSSWDGLRSPPNCIEPSRPHHLWYSRAVGRLVAWEITLSSELSSSVLKQGGSQ